VKVGNKIKVLNVEKLKLFPQEKSDTDTHFEELISMMRSLMDQGQVQN
jgi:hypothetical protein